MKRCVFIDGCHGGGVLNSIIQGNENGGGITFPTNDDVTRDLNQDGIAQKSEQRTSQYIVIAGNQFSRIASSSFALALGAANSLVLKNTLEGHVGRFVSLGNRCHLVNAFGMDWYYELYDNVFVGNQIESCDVFYSMDIVGPLLDHPPARAGRNSIRCNRITNAPSAFRWMVINKPEQLEAPNEITGNCVNDPECVASGCELRSSGTVDFSLDEVGDLAEVGAKPGSGPQPEGQREPGRGL
jgi:hypothetical protein